jgi:hypothetical protein
MKYEVENAGGGNRKGAHDRRRYALVAAYDFSLRPMPFSLRFAVLKEAFQRGAQRSGDEDIPSVQRPSHHLRFEEAEILTLSNCLRHANVRPAMTEFAFSSMPPSIPSPVSNGTPLPALSAWR